MPSARTRSATVYGRMRLIGEKSLCANTSVPPRPLSRRGQQPCATTTQAWFAQKASRSQLPRRGKADASFRREACVPVCGGPGGDRALGGEVGARSGLCFVQDDEHVTLVHPASGLNGDRLHRAGCGGGDVVFHLHRFENAERFAFGDGVANPSYSRSRRPSPRSQVRSCERGSSVRLGARGACRWQGPPPAGGRSAPSFPSRGLRAARCGRGGCRRGRSARLRPTAAIR